MPLTRICVRNEYGLGTPELYKTANRDDPKAILNGVAISGLVGILRQLGDLAEFASEVFHDLQEQVLATAARNNKMMVRVQEIEAALPPLEKAVMSQSSHLHFAYTTGSYWRRKIQTEQNHLIYSDLPQFIVDSYEECHDPPCLNLLDKFDSGGSGACMKRYSDPSFFKRVLARSVSTDADKIQTDNEAHKIKKRGRRHRNGEVSRIGSMPHQNGSMQLASPTVYGQSSDAEKVFLFDARSNSEPQDHSSSFDSRNKSGFIDSIYDGSSSMRTEKEENNFFVTSRLKMQCPETLDSILPKQNGDAVGDLPHSSVQQPGIANESIGTWDEKSEIVKSEIQQCENTVDEKFEASKLDPVSSEMSKFAKETLIPVYPDSDDTLIIDVKMPESVSVGNQFDEIESELDNYMDALNTMESEADSDFEGQTKCEVDLTPSNFVSTVLECGSAKIEKSSGQDSDSFDNECHYSSLNEKVPQNSVNLFAVECVPHQDALRITGMSCPGPEGPPRTNFFENNDILNVSIENESESVGPNSSLSSIPNSHAPSGDKIESSHCGSPESHVEAPSRPPNKFWTNGGLLGLEPSKPPDYNLSNDPSQRSPGDMNDGSCNVSRHGFMPRSHSDESVGKLEKELESARGELRSPNIVAPLRLVRNVEKNMVQTINQYRSSKIGNNNQNDGDSWIKVPCESIVPETNLEKSEGSPHNISSHAPELPVLPVVKIPFDEAHLQNTESPSNMFDLGHRLLVNGFQRKASVETSEPACSVKVGPVMLHEHLHNDQMNGKVSVVHQTAPPEETDCEFLENSPSSPPLGHMNISFHSINGFETSKLKLKFPDSSYFHENGRDVIFPSFQLLPEPSTPKQNIDSESDDDTFCRSSPCMPEDLLSHHSISSSEHWDSGDSTRSNGHEVQDALDRVSSTESIPAYLELQGLIPSYPCCGLKDPLTENSPENFHSSSLDLPSYDALSPLKYQHVSTSNSISEKFLQPQLTYHNDTLAPPPPLPPPRWHTMKHHMAVVDGKQMETTEAVNYSHDLLKLIPASPKQPHVKEGNEHPLNNKEKISGHREVSHATNAKEVDERGDFLHQIRTKQFSLRRTIPPRQSVMPDPPANVTAILKKANAIRQACVGSDEGEDDKWSDS